MRLCNWSEERVCTDKEKDLSVVKKRKRRNAWFSWWTIKEEIYYALKVTSNSTSVPCRNEE